MSKIIILSGGISAERDVSLETSRTIKASLEQADIVSEIIDPVNYNGWFHLMKTLVEKAPDLVFIGLHGATGEDGKLQAMLELCELPFSGSGSHASNLAMDKNTALALAAKMGIPTADHILIHKKNIPDIKTIIDKTGLPQVIKPNNSGSSVGISIVKKENELNRAIEKALIHDNYILSERFIPGRELTVSILDGKALPVVEIKPHSGWYDYTNKYTHGKTEYICPADLSAAEKNIVSGYAEQIFDRLGCSVYGRIDFRYNNKEFYFLEVNTLPGMTSLSLTPMAAKTAGLELTELLLKIIELSKKTKRT